MKSFLILAALVAVAFADGDTYKPPEEVADVETVVTNPEKLKGLTNCYLDKGDCTANAAYMKKVLPEVIATACGKCTPAQKHMLKRYLEEVKKTLPEDFEALKKKYDSEGKYVEALRTALADA